MDALLTPREVDLLFNWPRGRAKKLAKAGAMPAIVLPDGEIRFNPRQIKSLMQPQPAKDGDCNA